MIGLAVVLALSLTLSPVVAEAQQGTKVHRVGVLSERSPTDLYVTAFSQGLRALGYTENQNIIVEYRYAHGMTDRFPDLLAELIRLKVDVLVVGGISYSDSLRWP
jgi:putative tryptophan/tyrosine transport system substrate-binding protein